MRNLADLLKYLPLRKAEANKYDFGSVLILAGDEGMAGAGRICAEACLRCGAGLVILATHPSHAETASLACPEIICHGIHDPKELEPFLKKAKVLALGPGLTQSPWSQSSLQFLLHYTHLPMVIDAGALNFIKPMSGPHPHWILTPHVGEAARLLDCTVEQIQADRLKAVNALQQKYGGVIVLKGAHTLIADGKEVNTIEAGNPGMASAGMGDLLTGVIAALIAQDCSLTDAAQLGALLHATACDQCAAEQGERGILALDLLPYLHRLINMRALTE
ncbi:MAG: NAD(P)H-hydrate dehydratase [Gammaproteobacteria bacterium]|nr:NAD(P)H-hydrate dehydratase [Gammaproteobacteria bacterium]